MKKILSKTQFKAQVLAYFRQVQSSKSPIIITDRGKPVLKIVSYVEPSEEEVFKELRNTEVPSNPMMNLSNR